jgi:hypothetical protein
VNQGGGVERVDEIFGYHFHGGELSEFVVDEREQVSGGLAVAGRSSIEEAGHIGHTAKCNWGVRPGNLKGVVRPSALPLDGYRPGEARRRDSRDRRGHFDADCKLPKRSKVE